MNSGTRNLQPAHTDDGKARNIVVYGKVFAIHISSCVLLRIRNSCLDFMALYSAESLAAVPLCVFANIRWSLGLPWATDLGLREFLTKEDASQL